MEENSPPSRRERERERHRQEILEVAEALLLERGLEGTTMEEIARRSEFAVGSLYRFFGSKEDLVQAIVVSRVDHFSDGLDALIAEPAQPFFDRLERFFLFYAREVERSYPLMRILFHGARPAFKPEELSAFAERRERIVAAVTVLVAQGDAEGALRTPEPRLGAIVLLSLLDGLGRAQWFTGQTDLNTIVPVARHAFLDGFRRRDLEEKS